MYPRNLAAIHSRFVSLLAAAATLCWMSLLAGCNGGGDGTAATGIGLNSDAPESSSIAMTGVAAIGRPLDGYVYIQDTAGSVVNAPIAADGTYLVDVSGMLPPFIVRAQAGDGSAWYSYAPSRVPANVSQLTTLVMFLANHKMDLADLFDNWPQRHASLTADAMLHAQAVVNLNFGALFAQHGLDHTTYNFFTADFAADSTGFDAVLDAIGPISFGAGTYQFGNPTHQAAFDENIPVTDQGMIDSLGSSSTWTLVQPDLGSGIIIHQDPPGSGVIIPGDDSGILQPPPLDAGIMICAGMEYTCPEGRTCTIVECPADGSQDGGSSGGYESISSSSGAYLGSAGTLN